MPSDTRYWWIGKVRGSCLHLRAAMKPATTGYRPLLAARYRLAGSPFRRLRIVRQPRFSSPDFLDRGRPGIGEMPRYTGLIVTLP
jgi:hypothetical protein